MAELRSYSLSFPQVVFRMIKNVKTIVVYGLYVYCVYGPVVSCFCTLFHLVLTQHGEVSIIISLLKMKKLRLREVTQITQKVSDRGLVCVIPCGTLLSITLLGRLLLRQCIGGNIRGLSIRVIIPGGRSRGVGTGA